MAAEEAKPVSLLDQLRAESVRRGTCSVCEWVEAQPNAAEWDAIMAVPWRDINSVVIHNHIQPLGFSKESKAIQTHRSKGHRVTGG